MSWETAAHHLLHHQATQLAAILADLDPDEPALITYKNRHKYDPRSSEGDKQRMRAIPIQAKGVGGTIPGTDPLAALVSRERWTSIRPSG